MRIIQLTAENVKRLKAVQITPDKNVVIIGGKNGHGKTSVIDAISMALGGASQICSEPLRIGAKRGKASVDIGDLVVTRTFTEAGGGSLTVTNKQGLPQKTPQAMLDALLSGLSFDPLEFIRAKPADQKETVRRLVGLDFSKLDEERAKVFAERTIANREAAQAETLFNQCQRHENVPAAEVSISELNRKLSQANSHNVVSQDGYLWPAYIGHS